MRRSPSRSAAATLALVFALTGCSSPDIPPIDSKVPTSSVLPSRSLPPVTGKWARLKSTCPQLTGEAAGNLFVSGPGEPTDESRQLPEVTEADCHWGAEAGNSVDAKIEIWSKQAAADAGWQIIADTMTEPLPVGQQGFLSETPFTAIVAYVRTNNVLVTVKIYPPGATTKPVTQQALDKVRPYAKGVTEDVLDDLVPA